MGEKHIYIYFFVFFFFYFLGNRRTGGGGREGGEGDDGQVHSLATLQMFALIHGQATSASTEAVSLRAELAPMAHFAKKLALVLGAVCRVE